MGWEGYGVLYVSTLDWMMAGWLLGCEVVAVVGDS